MSELNIEAERVMRLEIVDKIEAIIDSTTIFRKRAEGLACFALLRELRASIARRAAPAEVDAEGLPPPPSDDGLRKLWNRANKDGTSAWGKAECETTQHVWRMRKIYEAVARDAIAADRRARGES